MTTPSSPEPATSLPERILRAAHAVRSGASDAPFLLRLADAETRRSGGALAPYLGQVLERLHDREAAAELWEDAVAWSLIALGGALEREGAHADARSVFELAGTFRPRCAATALHAGRAARRAGHAEAAIGHYRRAQALDEDGRIARLARIGEAMVSPGPEGRLSREIRRAVRSGDPVAAAMGLEARALVRCQASRCEGAIRDLCACALRYPDRQDRTRAAERVAELLIGSGELEAGREALLLVCALGTSEQRTAAEVRLAQVSARLGDALGIRRWGRSGRGDRTDVTAPVPASPPADAAARSLPVVREWRHAVERSAGAQ